MKDFKDKVAVITGAGAGIGQTMAIALAKEGCHIALTDISEKGLQETAEKLKPYGVNVSQHIVDVTKRESVEALPEQVIAAHGKVNLIHNNAGMVMQKSFESHSIEDWELAIGINLWGVIYTTKAFLPYLKESAKAGRGNAHIINMCSLASFLGMPYTASYAATKAAVKSISETMWAEHYAEGIGVTGVYPGAVKTNILQVHMDKSSNKTAAQNNADKVKKIAMTPEKCVQKIIKAVKNDKIRVLMGVDARAIELLKRFLPSAIHKPFVKSYDSESA